MKSMKIFSIVQFEEPWTSRAWVDVPLSFEDYDKAKEELVNRIITHVEERKDYAYALWHDCNHEDLREEVLKVPGGKEIARLYFEREDEENLRMPCAIRDTVIAYVKNEVEISGAYLICQEDGDQPEYHFSIEPNYLVFGD